MGWGDKLNQFTKSAVSKGKEMAEISRLNIENGTNEQKIRDLAGQIGMYVVEQNLLAEDLQVADWVAKITKLKEAIAKNQETIQEIRNINVCANCGAEVPRTSNFCNKCGSPMNTTILEDSIANSVPTCPNCGQKLDSGALFCTNCGTKLSD